MPLFVLIVLGYILKKKDFISEIFIIISNRMIFYIFLPITIFVSIYNTDLSELTSMKFALFALGSTTLSFVVTWAIAVFFIKDKRILGAFVQGAFRANTVFIGLPLMRNLAGDIGMARFALIIALVMPITNVFAILVLSVNSENEKKIELIPLVFTIIKNPLFIATILGILVAGFNINLPVIATRALDDLSHVTTPLALICLGGGITFLGFDKKFKYSVIASAIKIFILPILFTIAAYAFGFREIDLAAFMILGGVPSAIIGYAMVVEMDGDAYTASNIVLISTLFSAFTLTLFIYVMMVMGLL
jgi:predicted permease